MFHRLGGFEPRFETAEAAAAEFVFRAANLGSYVLPLAVGGPGALPGPATHAESPDDRALLRQLCPLLRGPGGESRFAIPKVSIYIPAHNAARFIFEAVDSVLSQDYADLEVCIADDGSSDATLDVLERHFGADPRVRWLSGRGGGIGCASNAAIRATRGVYVGQLDSDDLLKPGAVRRLAGYLDENPAIGCVYSSCERIDAMGGPLGPEFSHPLFSREKMMITSIAHHFRMFRRQVWERTEACREDIINAVDYDMLLKMSEVAPLHHIDEVLYQRRWHGANTSSVNALQQTANTHVVQRKSLERQGLDRYWDLQVPDPAKPRSVTYRRRGAATRVFFWPDYNHTNPYQRLLYAAAREAVDFIGADIDAVLRAARDRAAAQDSSQDAGQDTGQIVFHLHWLNMVLQSVPTRAGADAAVGSFLAKLADLKALGVRLIWTVHNVLSHHMPWQEAEMALARGVMALADVVHVHSLASLPEIEAFYPVPRDKLQVLRHGAYCGFYPDFITRRIARDTLGLVETDDVVLFLGRIRPYKGVDQLITAFRAILRDRPRALLLLGGQSPDDPLGDLAPSERARIRFCNRFIDDAELQVFLRAADLAVFPYRQHPDLGVAAAGAQLWLAGGGAAGRHDARCAGRRADGRGRVWGGRALRSGGRGGRIGTGDPRSSGPQADRAACRHGAGGDGAGTGHALAGFSPGAAGGRGIGPHPGQTDDNGVSYEQGTKATG